MVAPQPCQALFVCSRGYHIATATDKLIHTECGPVVHEERVAFGFHRARGEVEGWRLFFFFFLLLLRSRALPRPADGSS